MNAIRFYCLFSFLTIFRYIPFWSLWILTSVIAASGYWVCKKLIVELNSYNVKNVVNFDKDENRNDDLLEEACYSLANTEAQKQLCCCLALEVKTIPKYFDLVLDDFHESALGNDLFQYYWRHLAEQPMALLRSL